MIQYLELLKDVLKNGEEKEDRTGTGTLSVFGRQLRFNLSDGFPVVTTKKIHLKSIIHELLWFLKGSTDISYLKENKVTIWNEWADLKGELGPVYGYQWRKWNKPFKRFECGMGADGGWYNDEWSVDYIDQIEEVINSIKENPFSRRLIVSAWNVSDIDKMALPPCHLLFQFNCRPISFENRCKYFNKDISFNEKSNREKLNIEKEINLKNIPKYYLDCSLYQRSCDLFLGVPFNITSYSLLLSMISQVTNCIPGDFIWTGGDVHIYKNHIDQVKTQINRIPKKLPELFLNKNIKDIDDFVYDDIKILNYDYHPAIKADISI